jgi:hypothetical protein
MKIHPVGANFFHVDRWMDTVMNLIDTFHSFVSASKSGGRGIAGLTKYDALW